MNIEYIGLALLLGLLFFKYYTNIKIYGIFAGVVALFLAITFATTFIMLTIIFALFSVYLFYDAIYR